jgi:replication-associated recombination protein RarA
MASTKPNAAPKAAASKGKAEKASKVEGAQVVAKGYVPTMQKRCKEEIRTKLMKELGYAEDYKYAHNYAGNFVDQEFLPKEISGKVFYNPANNPKEAELRRSLATKWKKYNY